MNKESYYFPHDYEPIGDPKMQAFVGEYGAVGYGIFWRIVEMLHADPTHKLPLKQYIFLAIAKQMLTSAEQIQAIIQYAINTCELFISDEEYFWSNRVNSNFAKRTELSEKRAVAGRLGAIAKQNLANSGKIKGKEIKIKEEEKEKSRTTIPKIKNSSTNSEKSGLKKKSFIPPDIGEVIEYFINNGYTRQAARRAYDHYSLADWHDTNGHQVLNWKQKIHTVWFTEENKVGNEKINYHKQPNSNGSQASGLTSDYSEIPDKVIN